MSRLIESFWAGDRVSGTDADRHEDISHNGNSRFGDNADIAEMTDLGRVLIDARIAEQRARYKSSFRAIEDTICNKPHP